MDIEFDPAKDAANVAKHGVLLTAAALLDVYAVIRDERADYGDDRFDAFGTIEGIAYCLTLTIRADAPRAISRRRARAKEYNRHVV